MSNPPLYKDIPLQRRFACEDTTIIVNVQGFCIKNVAIYVMPRVCGRTYTRG